MPDAVRSRSPQLAFRRPPGAISVFIRAAADQRPAALEAGATCPRLEGRIDRLTWRNGLLSRFRDICGFPSGDTLPITFPHVLAAGLHGRMLQRPEFPVRLPGLIHVWHEISQHRPLLADESLAMECRIEGHRMVAAGAEFCLETRVTSAGEQVWEEKTGFISRVRKREGSKSPLARENPPLEPRRVAAWRAGAGIGRRYARASGDYNPIHLFNAAARRFGFPSAIAHGMWTLSRSAAELENHQAMACRRLFVQFKRPVFIPQDLVLLAAPKTDGEVGFLVSDRAENSVFLEGVWQPS